MAKVALPRKGPTVGKMPAPRPWDLYALARQNTLYVSHCMCEPRNDAALLSPALEGNVTAKVTSHVTSNVTHQRPNPAYEESFTVKHARGAWHC